MSSEQEKKLPNHIQAEERVQIARETNRIHLPREVKKWIQSLDLSYKINQINRDLANGFCVAEILSRYPVPYVTNLPYQVTNRYRVNMQEFSNGESFQERTTNWKHITKILNKFYQMPIPSDLPGKIINHAPNAAFEFLCLLYKFLTKRNVNILNKVDETDEFRNYNEIEVLPKYMRPTASILVRNKEVQRIPDDLVRSSKLSEILQKHNEFLSNERENFIKEKQYQKEKERLQKSQKSQLIKSKNTNNQEGSNRMSSNMNKDNEIGEVKESENSIGSDKGKEEKINLMGLLSEVSTVMKENENVEGEFRSLIKKNFVESDRNIELDLKNYTEEKDVIEFFFEKIDLCTEEHFTRICSAYEDKEKDLIGIISRTIIELIPFIKLVCKFFDAFYKNRIPWGNFKASTLKICNSVREIDEDQCDNVFINFCLDPVLDMIKSNPLYRNEMCQLIFSCALNTPESHYNILRKISKKFANTDELLFYHILVQCMNNIKESDESIGEEGLFFYMDNIAKGLTSSCDLIKIKSMSLVIQLMKFVGFDCLQYHENIFKHINSCNWEILGLILIYCSQMLDLFNRQKIAREHQEQTGELSHSPQEEEKNMEIPEKEKSHLSGISQGEKKSNTNSKFGSRKESIKPPNASQEPQRPQEEERENQQESIKQEEPENQNNPLSPAPPEVQETIQSKEAPQEEPLSQSNPDGENLKEKTEAAEQGEQGEQKEEEEVQKEVNIDEYKKKIEEDFQEFSAKEETFLQIIDHIFDLPSPRMTVKLGFIYLAQILEFYPELGKKYMKLLIEYEDSSIRKEVLSVKNSSEESEYTINSYTERYKFCGAPYFWNQLFVAGIFRDYVKENLDHFSRPHIRIFYSIIEHQNFNEADSQEWIVLYNDLKRYLFVALCEDEFSDTAINICNKIFSFEKILKELLESTFDLFISTMVLIYDDDNKSKSQENMKSLLTFISELKSENNDCKGYVYKLIKTFAIKNNKIYLKSNLLDLMNSIYNEKRGKIFQDTPNNSQLN